VQLNTSAYNAPTGRLCLWRGRLLGHTLVHAVVAHTFARCVVNTCNTMHKWCRLVSVAAPARCQYARNSFAYASTALHVGSVQASLTVYRNGVTPSATAPMCTGAKRTRFDVTCKSRSSPAEASVNIRVFPFVPKFPMQQCEFDFVSNPFQKTCTCVHGQVAIMSVCDVRAKSVYSSTRVCICVANNLQTHTQWCGVGLQRGTKTLPSTSCTWPEHIV